MHPDSVLLYDGLCNLCDATVQFVLARDRTGTLRFAPLQGTYASTVLARHPALQRMRSVVLVHPASATMPEHVATESDAALELAHYLGGSWRVLAAVLGVVPRFLRNAGYRAIARVRYRAFGTRAACRIPTDAERARFLD